MISVYHYRRGVFQNSQRAKKGRAPYLSHSFFFFHWKESNIQQVSEDELCAVVLTWVQLRYQKAQSRWQACGWGADCWDSRRNKRRIAGYWENCKCEWAWLCAFLATLPCTSIWGMNMLERYRLVGGMWWDNNTLRWLIRAWGELLFISRYSLPCYESSDTLKTENRLQWSMQYSWLGISKVEELEEQAKCVPAPLQLAHLGFGNMGWGGRRLVHFQVMTQLGLEVGRRLTQIQKLGNTSQ